MKKQTAVEWLVEQLKDMEYDLRLIPNTIEQALSMEKEQIINAYKKGKFNAQINYGYGNNVTAEQYYTHTFTEQPEQWNS